MSDLQLSSLRCQLLGSISKILFYSIPYQPLILFNICISICLQMNLTWRYLADMLTISSIGQNILYNKLPLILAHESIFIVIKAASIEIYCYKILKNKEKTGHHKLSKYLQFVLSFIYVWMFSGKQWYIAFHFHIMFVDSTSNKSNQSIQIKMYLYSPFYMQACHRGLLYKILIVIHWSVINELNWLGR